MILYQGRSQKAGEQGKQSLYISTALKDSAVSAVVSWCLNAKGRPQTGLTIEHIASRNLRKSSISAQSSCWNRWLTGVIQPTFSPQKKTKAIGKTNPVLLMNLHSRSAQNCGIPLVPHKIGMASQGLRIHKPHAHRLVPHQVLLLVPQFSTYMVLFPYQIFNLQTREPNQALRHNVNHFQAQSLQV